LQAPWTRGTRPNLFLRRWCVRRHRRCAAAIERAHDRPRLQAACESFQAGTRWLRGCRAARSAAARYERGTAKLSLAGRAWVGLRAGCCDTRTPAALDRGCAARTSAAPPHHTRDDVTVLSTWTTCMPPPCEACARFNAAAPAGGFCSRAPVAARVAGAWPCCGGRCSGGAPCSVLLLHQCRPCPACAHWLAARCASLSSRLQSTAVNWPAEQKRAPGRPAD
jgi:hypothetical protein